MEHVRAAAPVIEDHFDGLADGRFELDHFLHGFLKLYGDSEVTPNLSKTKRTKAVKDKHK
jgi:hypothetical protein